jgi:hypothetical protein
MILLWGLYRETKVAPNQEELLACHVHCGRITCSGRVKVIEVTRRCHYCFIPLFPLSTCKLVKCSTCPYLVDMPVHCTLKATTAKGRLELLRRATEEANARRVAAHPQEEGKEQKAPSAPFAMAHVLIQEETKTNSPMPEEEDENANDSNSLAEATPMQIV